MEWPSSQSRRRRRRAASSSSGRSTPSCLPACPHAEGHNPQLMGSPSPACPHAEGHNSTKVLVAAPVPPPRAARRIASTNRGARRGRRGHHGEAAVRGDSNAASSDCTSPSSVAFIRSGSKSLRSLLSDSSKPSQYARYAWTTYCMTCMRSSMRRTGLGTFQCIWDLQVLFRADSKLLRELGVE